MQTTKTKLLINGQKVIIGNQFLVDIARSSNLSKKFLFKIIKTDNIKFLNTIAKNVGDYVKCNLCKIVKILSRDKDINVVQNAKDKLIRRDKK